MLEPSRPRLSAARASTFLLVVPRRILDETVGELRARSAGWRESACVWAGTRDGGVKQVIFHHHIGDDHAGPLSLELPESAKLDLYARLASGKQFVLALLHTHPEDWVGLSLIDRQNQISSRVGFWSIVLPHYARNEWDAAEIGFHVRADRGWVTLTVDEATQALTVMET
jgi:proteasome lid subunit RPN8/RPN11